MLPTPPRGDAVPVGYRPESAYLKRTHTSLTWHTYRRTIRGLMPPARPDTPDERVTIAPGVCRSETPGADATGLSRIRLGNLAVKKGPDERVVRVPDFAIE